MICLWFVYALLPAKGGLPERISSNNKQQTTSKPNICTVEATAGGTLVLAVGI
jgi:hypothetical protein